MTVPPPAEIRRVVYLGTPAEAVPPLEALVTSGHEVALVISGEDKRRGRGGALTASPVKEAALELHLPVTSELDRVLEVNADLGIVVAFGGLVPVSILDVLPMVNIHFSLLPRWRGAAPVERAILAGDRETGVCLMAVDEELDTGAVYRRAVVPIEPDETADELRQRLVEIGTIQLIEALEEGFGEPEPQIGEPVYANKLAPSELCLDWHRPAEELHRVVRLGGAWTTLRGKRLKVERASVVDEAPAPGHLDGVVVGTGSGGLALVAVQPEGRSVQPAVDWLRGARLTSDDRLGS